MEEKIDETARGIKTTTMALREVLMEYFKGSCVERYTDRRGISVNPLSEPRQFQYQREEYSRRSPKVILVGKLPVLTIRKAPDELTFHDTVLKRSPQLSEVYANLEDFMDKYLMAVTVERSEEKVFYAS